MIDYCISYFSVVTSNTLTKSKIGKKMFTMTYSLRGKTVYHGREGMTAKGRDPQRVVRKVTFYPIQEVERETH